MTNGKLLLDVEHLRVGFRTEDGVVQAVDDVSFQLRSGEVLAIVGESGSGKSVSALTLMGLTPRVNAMFEGTATLEGQDLLNASDDELRRLQRLSGEYRSQLAQGSAFGATARVRADLVVPHCEAAVRVLCAMTAAEADEMTEQRRPGTPDSGQLPAYEAWRQRVADQFVAIERT